MTDAELADLFRAGDSGAVRLIAARNNQRLFRAAWAILKDRGEAEDAVQSGYLKAFAAIGTFEGRSKLSTWLTRIVINEALIRLRTERRRARATGEAQALEAESDRDQLLNPANWPNPEFHVANAQLKQTLQWALNRLPEIYRIVFILREIEGMTVDETAVALDILPATVKTRFFRARQMLQADLADIEPAELEGFLTFAGDICGALTERLVNRIAGEKTLPDPHHATIRGILPMPTDSSSSARSGWRKFRVARIVTESAVIKSFHLEPADGAAAAQHRAGQHLPIRLPQPGGEPPLLRTYTISVAPSAPRLRISVRKLGAGSSFLHDAIKVGDTIDCREPAGDFVIDATLAHPAVLIAAGVGITPILAMTGHLVDEGERTGAMRRTTLFYAARSKAERGFEQELNRLATRANGRLTIVRLLKDADDAVAGEDFEEQGLLSESIFAKYLGFQRYDFHMCGPPSFMQATYDALTGCGVPDERIFAEAFGPSALKRQPSVGATAHKAVASTTAVEVTFNAAGQKGIWTADSGSLLEFAEACGLTPEFGCRQGACGACKTPMLAGAVAYFRETSAAHTEREVLICSAVPAAAADGSSPPLRLSIG